MKQSEANQTVEQASEGKHEGEAGCNYVNENGKHPGESGYGYNEKKQGTLFPSGIYNDVNGTNASLEIATYDGITCYCTVTLPNGIGRQVIYGFMGTASGSTMEYTGATKNDRTIDENGAIINTTLIEKNHYGTVNRTEKGLVHRRKQLRFRSITAEDKRKGGYIYEKSIYRSIGCSCSIWHYP